MPAIVLLDFDCFGYIDEFPDTPWLDLDADLRGDYIERIKQTAEDYQFFRALTVRFDPDGREMEWPAWRKHYQLLRPGSVCGWFAIHPGFSQEQVLNQFDSNLGHISKDHAELFSTKAGGRGGPGDALKQLGAYRLLCGRSPALAARLVAKHTDGRGARCRLYTEDDDFSWYRARNAAQERIAQFDEIAGDFLELFRSLDQR